MLFRSAWAQYQLDKTNEVKMDEAEQKVNEVLRLQYDNPDARELQTNITNRREYLKKWKRAGEGG